MRHLPSIALMALLSACAAGGSDRPCFALVPYSAEIQRQAAAELAALPRDAALARVIVAAVVGVLAWRLRRPT